MHASGILPSGNSLYLICDGEACAAKNISREDYLSGALAGGVRVVQYRHKNVTEHEYAENIQPLAELCRRHAATLIVNDYAAVAEQYLLPLHLGQTDVLPRELSVPYGRSTHNTAELDGALAAHPAPAYVALGTMFPGGTKPEIAPARALVELFLKKTALPLVLIGGITRDNVHLLPHAERIYYAVIGDAFRFGATREGIESYTRNWMH